MEASRVASKYEFSEKMEEEFGFLFFTNDESKSSTEGGQEAKAQKFRWSAALRGGSLQIYVLCVIFVLRSVFKVLRFDNVAYITVNGFKFGMVEFDSVYFCHL